VSAPTVRRTTARVIPVNAQGEALLMLSRDPAHPDVTYWCSFGGAVEEGETLAEAGARELHEETGLVVDAADLGEPFERGEVTFPYNGVVLVNDSTWFAVRLEADHSALRAHDEFEEILDYRWWSVEALESDAAVNNDRLPAFVRGAVDHVSRRA
jgi:8-oxo-dGTP pyrophosphatase MutT (NUDIX family)